MLWFLSKSGISTTLTKQPSAYYSEYLREFWYFAKVDGATNLITVTLSNFDKPLSFGIDEFSSIIGLNYSENYVSAPKNETVRARLETLGLVDEKTLSTALVNYSSLKVKYFSPIQRVLMLYVFKSNIIFSDLVDLTSHMLKLAQISKEPEETLILPSKGVNTGNIIDKSLSKITVHPVGQSKASTDKRSKRGKPHLYLNPRHQKLLRNQLQRNKSPRLSMLRNQWPPDDGTKSPETSGLAEELRNQPKPIDAKRVRVSTSISISSIHSESALGNYRLRFIPLDVDPENSRLCKDL
ncbi:hypothetical protein Tco_1269400 [Tanacetum coccineum]